MLFGGFASYVTVKTIYFGFVCVPDELEVDTLTLVKLHLYTVDVGAVTVSVVTPAPAINVIPNMIVYCPCERAFEKENALIVVVIAEEPVVVIK